MKVVHVITRLILGGAQENTLHTVEDQHLLHGDDVTLITGPADGPEGTLIPRAARGEFRLELVPDLVRSIRPRSDWRAFRTLVRLLRQIDPEIVHTHSSKAGMIGRAAAQKLGLPVVHTIHGASFHYGQSAIAYRAYIAAEKWAARRTDKFISVADAMSEEYIVKGIAPREKFVTIHSGFDVDPYLNPPRSRAEIRQELGVADNHVLIGKVARLFHLKGHEFLIRAAGKIVDTCPEVRFVLVGDGILRDEFQRQIQKAGLAEHFLFTGLVPTTRVPELMNALDIVTHTSQWEGLARVIPQAFLAGKPVVSYDVGGARELVIPGRTGFILPLNAVNQLSDALIELATDAPLRQRYGEAGRELCRTTFRHQYMTERIREIYQTVLSHHRRT